MSKTIEITRTEDIRPGDRVTLVWNCDDDDTTVSGIVRSAIGGRRLELANRSFWLSDDPEDWHVTAATREVPDVPPLPTEPGSVIANATIRGVEGQTAILCDSGDWLTPRPVAEIHYYHTPQRITAWEPARIVPESEED